jgi:hypothetical protein
MVDLAVLINSIQRNTIAEGDKGLVCQAVQAYYKVLQAVGAVRKGSASKAVKEGENNVRGKRKSGK